MKTISNVKFVVFDISAEYGINIIDLLKEDIAFWNSQVFDCLRITIIINRYALYRHCYL